MAQHRASVPHCAGPLPSGCTLKGCATLPFAVALAAFALAPEHALLQITYLRLSQPQFGNQQRFALGRLHLEPVKKAPVLLLVTGLAGNAAIKLATPICRITTVRLNA